MSAEPYIDGGEWGPRNSQYREDKPTPPEVRDPAPAKRPMPMEVHDDPVEDFEAEEGTQSKFGTSITHYGVKAESGEAEHGPTGPYVQGAFRPTRNAVKMPTLKIKPKRRYPYG